MFKRVNQLFRWTTVKYAYQTHHFIRQDENKYIMEPHVSRSKVEYAKSIQGNKVGTWDFISWTFYYQRKEKERKT